MKPKALLGDGLWKFAQRIFLVGFQVPTTVTIMTGSARTQNVQREAQDAVYQQSGTFFSSRGCVSLEYFVSKGCDSQS